MHAVTGKIITGRPFSEGTSNWMPHTKNYAIVWQRSWNLKRRCRSSWRR